MQSSSKPFAGSDNKVVVRKRWDLPILEHRAARIGRRLDYFGLPGPRIEDLRDWANVLGYRTGVERLRSGADEAEDRETHRRILANVSKYKLSAQFELLRGNVEDIIIDGFDRDGKRPFRSEGPVPMSARFAYNVVNLDFFGGMGNIATSDNQRVQMLKKLLERQQGTDFTLLLTVNVRDKVREKLAIYIDDAKKRATSERMYDMLDWYRAQATNRKEFLLKAVVPLFIKRFAEHYSFDCHCYPPLVYTGTGSARMVHFAFDLACTGALLDASSRQTEEDVLDLTFFEVVRQAVRIGPTQHQHWGPPQTAEHVSFLPPEVAAAMAIPGSASSSG